ncbi:MAG: hypothetical protein HKP23_07815 [Flavobacteriaceae bacterium]|nr:hypothetical protein [Eudoraea sp.]NNJ39133.1 hypothetical protein [Flavobacteriaceae bacterium]
MKEKIQIRTEQLSCSQLHAATRSWISSMRFIEDELTFIENLLHSYVFEPNTPNLFERLQDYLERLQTINKQKKNITKQLREHENSLSGVLECKDHPGGKSYRDRHRELHIEYLLFETDYQKLKTEIFNYAGGVLKKRKPPS